MRRRITKGDSTRQAIIERTAEVFNQRGFEGSSLADLMDATGLKKGGIYNHFASKQQLAVEAVKYALEVSAAHHLASLSAEGNAAARLKAMIGNFANSPIPGGCPLQNAAVDNDDGNQELRSLASSAAKRLHSAIKGVLDEGVAAKEFRSDTDTHKAATVIIAALEGGLMLTKLHGTMSFLLEASESLYWYIDHSLRGPVQNPAR